MGHARQRTTRSPRPVSYTHLADLARDNVARKPAFGKVQPALMGQTDSTYKCEVDQVIVGVDQIDALNYQRSRAPGVADPRRAKAVSYTHLDVYKRQPVLR